MSQAIRLQNRALTITGREAEKRGDTGMCHGAGMTIPVLQSQLETARHTLPPVLCSARSSEDGISLT